MSNDFLVLKNVHKSFDHATIIEDLNLKIRKGSMVTLLGPSGCGKTTILRLIAGLESVDSGQILIEGEDVTNSSIQQRDICIVFQHYALFPHLSVADNVGYGLKMQGINKTERQQRIQEALTLVDLAGFESRFIDQLSGGQQQRVALARALILKPKILLFDEPLSNLDTNLRRSMREKIRELQQQLSITALYVTHDQTEAFAVSDEVIVMHHGKIIQQGTAKSLYQHPRSLFLANFMGEANFFDGELTGNKLNFNGYQLPFEHADQFGITDGKCLVGIRPEAIKLDTESEETQQCFIKQAIYMGNHWEITAEWAGKTLLINASPEEFNGEQSSFICFSTQGIFLLPRDSTE